MQSFGLLWTSAAGFIEKRKPSFFDKSFIIVALFRPRFRRVLRILTQNTNFRFASKPGEVFGGGFVRFRQSCHIRPNLVEALNGGFGGFRQICHIPTKPGEVFGVDFW